MPRIRRSLCLSLAAVLAIAACGGDDDLASPEAGTSGSDTSTVVAARLPSDPTAGVDEVSGVNEPDIPTLVVAGDSIMYDVAPALVEALDPTAASVLPVVAPSLAAESSRATLVGRIDASNPDFVVVMVGVWERAHVTGSGFVLGDPGFAPEYGSEALQPVVDAVAEAGGRLLILGPPRLREVAAEQQIAALERIWTDFATAHPEVVDYVDADTWLGSGPDFREIEHEGDTTIRLRRTDGIHLCEEGARRIASGVLAALGTHRPDGGPAPIDGWEHGAWTERFPVDECPPVA